MDWFFLIYVFQFLTKLADSFGDYEFPTGKNINGISVISLR